MKWFKIGFSLYSLRTVCQIVLNVQVIAVGIPLGYNSYRFSGII